MDLLWYFESTLVFKIVHNIIFLNELLCQNCNAMPNFGLVMLLRYVTNKSFMTSTPDWEFFKGFGTNVQNVCVCFINVGRCYVAT